MIVKHLRCYSVKARMRPYLIVEMDVLTIHIDADVVRLEFADGDIGGTMP